MLTKLIKALTSSICRNRSETSSKTASIESVQELLAEGVSLHQSGRLTEAARNYEKILFANPREPDALHLLALVAQRKKEFDRAEELVRKAIAVCPRSTDYLNTLASILSEMALSEDAARLLRQALRIDKDALRPRSNLLFLLNLLPGTTRKEIFEEHVHWANIHTSRFSDANRRHLAGSKAKNLEGRRLRVGYVSGDFRSHPVGRIMSCVLPAHDKSRVEVICYDNTNEPDALNKRLKGFSDDWVEICGMNDDDVATKVGRDEIDVLIDLSGHTHGNRLLVFARRPAPVQASWLGYLNTTGMEQIDWRLTCRTADPEPQSSMFHSERLWYLPDCLWPWKPGPEVTDGDLDPLPAIQSATIVFGSFNTFRKLNRSVLAVWASILNQVPNSLLRIYGMPKGGTLDRVLDSFEGRGVQMGRVECYGVVEHDQFHQAYSDVHIALDSFPYSGGATTCECLWMGVPVLTIAGDGGFARTAASVLSTVGLEELISRDIDEYVKKAIELAHDPKVRRADYRQAIRNRMRTSSLLDAKRFVGHLEFGYFGMWQDWYRSAIAHGSSARQ